MSIDKAENIARCSIRGIKGLNIYKVLSEMSDCFVNYGGHELAGGFGADLTKVSVKELSNRINKIVSIITKIYILPNVKIYIVLSCVNVFKIFS